MNLSEKRLSLETNLANSNFLTQIFANTSRNALCVIDYTDLSYIVGMRLVLCPLSPPCFGHFSPCQNFSKGGFLLGPCHLWLSFHHAMPCLQVKRLLRRRSHREVAVSYRAHGCHTDLWVVAVSEPKEEKKCITFLGRKEHTLIYMPQRWRNTHGEKAVASYLISTSSQIC